jgi:SAM-dependent methyltransferase
VTSSTAVKRQREPLGKTQRECPICVSRNLEYKFVVDRAPVCGCEDCGLLFLNPQPSPMPADESAVPLDSARLRELYLANAAERIRQLVRYSGLHSGRLLIIGDAEHLPNEAKKAGFEVYSMLPRDFESATLSDLPGRVNACVLFCALEKMTDPLRALQTLRGLLRNDGRLMVVSPTTDSRAARIFRSSWWEFNRTNLFYFSSDTLQNLLIKAGFGDPLITADHSLVSLNYLRRRLAQNPRILRRYRVLSGLTRLSPVLRDKAFRLIRGRTRFLARPKPQSGTPSLSVIVPVYNEQATVVELLEQVLAKQIEGVNIDVIVVESNSTDGSRELVRRYADHPRVRLILEDKPRGKGYAVRTALKTATSDVILIQDADLEYDVNDYDALIAPILRYKRNFVLGSRHTESNSSWKIRTFSDSPGLSAYFNLGHALLLTMFNVVYSQNLTDPFTMFKVFRRDCLYGLKFECDRFDFDNEIVIKLIRKGYKPLELPVNYTSRSIQEGKKITLFLDPLRWIRALLKFRNTPLYDTTE